LTAEVREQVEKIEAGMEYFKGIEEIFETQRDLYLKKLNADFEVIFRLVERKHTELRAKVQEVYDKSLREAK